MGANCRPGGPLRVALVAPSLMVGGAEQQIVKLSRSAPHDDVLITIFLLFRDAPPVLRSELPPHVSVLITPYRKRDPRTINWLAGVMRAHRIDIAQSFLWYADAVASLSRALFSSIPLVCTERGDRSKGYYPATRNLYDRLFTFRVAATVCANSGYGGSILVSAGCDPAKVRVIYNGVDLQHIDTVEPLDLRRMLGWPGTSKIVGVVSRLVWYKGVDTLIDAVARIDPRHDVYCAIVGDGPERERLEGLARERGVAGRVAFLGMRSPAIPFVKGFDIAVLANRVDEHCSNAILEYMACGKPVIATRVGGNPELVTPGETGLLVEPGDADHLAGALETLLDGGNERSMGERGRIRIETDFRMELSARRFVDLWWSVLSDAGPGDKLSYRPSFTVGR